MRAESVRLAYWHQTLGDWDTVRTQAVAQNLLQARKRASATRIGRELVLQL